MSLTKLKKLALKGSAIAIATAALAACNIQIGPDGITITQGDGTGSGSDPVSTECGAVTNGVNWGALLEKNCANLSDYNLFADPTDPTKNPNAGGIPYDLTTQLFTDYASKYRFVFIPEGEQVQYSEHEAFEFPLGSVIVKTFAMPSDTAFRGENELVIETRLLIMREDGWVARPYYWGTPDDATLLITGKNIEGMTTTHNGESMEFTYGIPKATSCTSCHSVVPLIQDSDDMRQPIFKAIGPKARYLNKDYDYDGVIANQLQYWEQQGVLAGLPADFAQVSEAATFSDTSDLSQINGEELNHAAKSYLDINCAHCHRSDLTLPEPNYAGPAGSSGLKVEYNRSYAEDPAKFGVCKTAVAGGHEDYPHDVIPQNADESYLLFRMSTTDPRHKMPELGRSTVHQEGVALIRKWINNLPAAACSPQQ